ncbi:MAG: AsmA family protein [Flammeovirgaceae bacterium]
MRKFLIVLLSILLLLVITAAAIPIFFKDDIKALIDQKLEENLDATVYFDADQFDLTLFKDFPNLTVQLGDFGVVGKGAFENDTLADINQLNIELDIKKVLFGDQIEIAGITIDQPNFFVKVLKDGKANYDIYKGGAEEETPTEPQADEGFSLAIDHWEIIDGKVIYDDHTLPFLLDIEGLNHTGSGDITQDNYDLKLNTAIEQLTANYDGISYIKKSKLEADMILGIDMPASIYTFKENQLKLNDFGLSFDGYVKMLEETIEMDVDFASKESTFKSLLSLIPAIFLEDFEDLKTEGSLTFNGSVDGKYTETQLPGFMLNLGVKDGKFRYPDLPSEVKNVQIDMKVDASDGNLDNMLVDVKKFHLDFGSNPIHGKVSLRGLEEYNIDADINAKLNLEELLDIYPIDSLELKGVYSLNVVAKGLYSEKKSSIPTIDADMRLTDGYVKSLAYPIPMEKINFVANAKNSSGKMADFKLSIDTATLEMDGKPLSATGHVSNLDDIAYDLDVSGEMDLDLVEQLYPMPGTHLAGHVKADIHTKGKMSDIDAERYEKLPTSGSMTLKDFAYSSADLPQGATIKNAVMTFSPQAISLSNYQGTLGKSDIDLKGSISNYLAYVLKDEKVKGNLTFISKTFNTNEWMVDESGEEVSEEEGEYGVIEVPKNIDFILDAKIDKLIYENLNLNDLNGQIVIRDGIIQMNGLVFGMLGGQFVSNGSYDPRDLKAPKFDFGLNIKSFPILKAYQSYASIQQMAPIAQHMDGIASTNLSISGILGNDLMPIMSSLSGNGDLKVTDAMVQKGMPILERIGVLSGIKELNNPRLKDIDFKWNIKDGKVNIKPFPLKIAGFEANVGGASGLDGSLDYDVKVEVPTDKLSPQLQQQYQALTGKTTIPLTFDVAGMYNAPSVKLNKNQDALKDAVKDKIDEEKDKLKDDLKEGAKDALGNLITGKDSTKTTPGKDKLDSAKNQLKDLKDKFPFKKKKKDDG